MKILKKIDEIVIRVLRTFVIGLFIGIGLILFLRVLIRFTPLHISLSWTDEVVEWMMAWMIFTAATIIMRQGDHFRVDLLQTKFAGRAWIKVLNLAISLMGILFFSALLYYSIRLVAGAEWFSPILKVSTRVPYASMPFNCALMLLYLIRDMIVGFAGLIRPRKTAIPNQNNNEVA